MHGSADASAPLIISNVTGQVIFTSTASESRMGINVQHLPAGISFITLTGNEGKNVSRFIKQ